MAIEPITAEEFRAVEFHGPGIGLERRAVAALRPGDGFKVPCRWKHKGTSKQCGGAGWISTAARDMGFKVRTRCKDGVVYVFRPAEA